MRRIAGIAIFGFTQLVALVSILVGSTFLSELARTIRAAFTGQPWQGPELARLLACTCGPILLGIGLSIGLYWYLRSSSQLRRRTTAFPDQPWLWREEWQAKQVRLSNRTSAGLLIASASAYLLVIVPMGIYLASLKNAGMVYAFLMTLGAFLLIFIWRQWMNWHRNRSVLHLETLPGEISGEFRGLAVIPVSFPEGTAIQVRLLCELTQTTHARPGNTDDPVSVLTNTQNSRSRSETRTSIVYEARNLSTPADHRTTHHSTSVPVTFAIPGNLPSTGTVAESSGSGSRVTRHYSWSIRIRLSTESDLREIVFEIPVFNLSV